MNESSLISRFKASRHQTLIICLGLVFITLAVYWRVAGFDFINYDDNEYVTDNPWVGMGLKKESILWAFTTYHAANWHPLTWISHMTDCQLFGLWGGGHHLTSLLIHILNTVLLFLVLKQATREVGKCAFVAALFALHPLHIQSVAWVAERKDVLSTFFFLLATGAYLFHVERKQWKYYAAALGFMALGLMCKPMLVTLPGVLLLLDYWPLRRAWSIRLLLEKIPFVILSILSSVITFFAQGDAVITLVKLTFFMRVTNAAIAYFAYLYKMCWPVHLTIFYPHPVYWPVWLVVVSLGTLAAISLLVLVAYKHRPYLLAGWGWYLGTLVPVIGLVQVGSQAFADRYTYVPLVGIFIMMAWGVPDLLKKARLPELAPAAAALIVAACVCASGFQLTFWKNSLTLFERALIATPYNPIAELNFGAALSDADRADDAIMHYENALRIDPDHANIDLNYGLALLKKNDFNGAIFRFREAIKKNPHYFKAHANLANTLIRVGKLDEALQEYPGAIRLSPDNSSVHYNYANALLPARKPAEAEHEFRESLRLDITYVEAYDNLALLLVGQGRIDEALDLLAKAVQFGPDHFTAHYNYAAVLTKKGKIPEAIFHYREALRLNPDSVQALNNLASILATNPDPSLRNGQVAVKLAERALEITGRKDAYSWNNAAAAYAECDQFKEAVLAAEQALQLAKQAGQNNFADSIKARLDLYKQGIPAHDGKQ